MTTHYGKGNAFSIFREVVFEAHRRAALTGYRYRVTWDRANSLFDLQETTTRHAPEGPHE